MIDEQTYKGYRLRIKRTSEVSVMMWAPGDGLALNEIAYATLDEGNDTAIERAHQIIDADIANQIG